MPPHVLGRSLLPISNTILLLHGIIFLLYVWSPLLLAIPHPSQYTGPTTFSPILYDYIMSPFLIGTILLKPAFISTLSEKRMLYVTCAFGITVLGLLSAWDYSKGKEVVALKDGVGGIVFAVCDSWVFAITVEVEEWLRERGLERSVDGGEKI